MYHFENIGFRPIEEDDLYVLKNNHNYNDILLFLGHAELFSMTDQESWWATLVNNPKTKAYCIVKNPLSQETIGIFRQTNIDHINKNCEIGIDIFLDCRGQGYGYKSYRMVLEYLFQHMGMNCVYLRYIDFNERAKRLYDKLGFKETGRFPEFIYRHGKYWDYVLMCMTRRQYENENTGARCYGIPREKDL